MSSYQEGCDAFDRGDYETALKEWRPLAERGNEAAQASLGFMYAKGQEVAQNYIQAYMWITLAVAQGNEKAVKGLELLEKSMTLDELAEAQRLAREWKANGK